MEKPEKYFTNKCTIKSVTKIYTGQDVLTEEKFESIDYSGFDELEGVHVYKKYDKDGKLTYMGKDNENYSISESWDVENGDIEHCKHELFFDSNHNIVREVNVYNYGDVHEQIHTYNENNEHILLTFYTNGIEIEQIEEEYLGTVRRLESEYLEMILDENCEYKQTIEYQYYDSEGVIISNAESYHVYPIENSEDPIVTKIVHKEYLYSKELQKKLFNKHEGVFLATSMIDCFEANLLTLSKNIPHSLKIIIIEKYDIKGNLVEKKEAIGEIWIELYSSRHCFPLKNEMKQYCQERDKSTGNYLREFEEEYVDGKLRLEKTTYWEHESI